MPGQPVKSPVLESLDLGSPMLIEHESPDFLLQTARGDIGIEVTMVHRGADELGSPAWSGDCRSRIPERARGRSPL